MLDKTIGQILSETVEKNPDNEALIYVERGLRFSYREFDDFTDQLAKGLIRHGVKKGDHVAVWANNVPEWIQLQFGLAKIGAVLITVNTFYKSHELEYLLKQSDATTLIIVQGYRDVDYVETVNDVVPDLRESTPGDLNSEKFPTLKNVVYVGNFTPRGMLNFKDVIGEGYEVPDEVLKEREDSLDPQDVINIQYTSGTTGFPKGVQLTHYNIVNNAYYVGNRLNLTSKDRYCIPVPYFHCFGCVLSTLNSVIHGATMVPIESFDPLKVLIAIDREKCTAINGVPTMFIAVLQHPDFYGYDCSSLRTGIMAGAICPEEVMRQVMEKMNAGEITICYGLTETSPVLTQTNIDDSVQKRVETVGQVLEGVEVKIVDPDTGEDLPPNTPGELIARGYGIMKGYYKMEEATNNAVRDGWLHTKDLATMDEEGFVGILGRVDDMIIRGGENVYPREIEDFLFTNEKIKDVAVVGIPSKKYGEEVMAFIELKKGAMATEDEIKQYCRERISRFKVPKYIQFTGSFPMTASGKIQKYKLKEIGTKYVEELSASK